MNKLVYFSICQNWWNRCVFLSAAVIQILLTITEMKARARTRYSFSSRLVYFVNLLWVEGVDKSVVSVIKRPSFFSNRIFYWVNQFPESGCKHISRILWTVKIFALGYFAFANISCLNHDKSYGQWNEVPFLAKNNAKGHGSCLEITKSTRRSSSLFSTKTILNKQGCFFYVAEAQKMVWLYSDR